MLLDLWVPDAQGVRDIYSRGLGTGLNESVTEYTSFCAEILPASMYYRTKIEIIR